MAHRHVRRCPNSHRSYEETVMMSDCRDTAVVLGASMGGMLAARTLADGYRRVVVVERDCLPNDSGEPVVFRKTNIPMFYSARPWRYLVTDSPASSIDWSPTGQ
jgi:choline dehydrogenase-like flavoprotein